jgi:hypothetical protein
MTDDEQPTDELATRRHKLREFRETIRQDRPDHAERVERWQADQVASGDWRRITLSNGQGLLVEADDPRTDEEIRTALEGRPWPKAQTLSGARDLP